MTKTGNDSRAPNAVDAYIGARITSIREKKGMTQTELGAAMGGLTYQMVQKYELGHARIAAARLHVLAEVFDRPHGYFFPERGRR